MKKRNRGFTLLELMVVVVIAGILFGLGIPAMGNFVRNSRITSAANDVVGALHFARGEAMKRRVPVTFCTSTDPLVADPSCAASESLTGWIVFIDTNGDGTRQSTEEVLKQGVPPHASITGTAFSVDAGTGARTESDLTITWADTGFTIGGTARTLALCDARGNVGSGGELSAARAVTVSRTGRPTVTRDPTEIDNLGGCP